MADIIKFKRIEIILKDSEGNVVWDYGSSTMCPSFHKISAKTLQERLENSAELIRGTTEFYCRGGRFKFIKNRKKK